MNVSLEKPFFAQFLENQLSSDESSAVQGGGFSTRPNEDTAISTNVTRLFRFGRIVTMKYPSDGDDTGWPYDWP